MSWRLGGKGIDGELTEIAKEVLGKSDQWRQFPAMLGDKSVGAGR